MDSATKEGELLLNMFQKEFKKMHSDLAEKEVRLFHHIFHHLFSSRLAKIEQFLQINYEDFESFEPEYAPLDNPFGQPPTPTPPAPRLRPRRPQWKKRRGHVNIKEETDQDIMEEDDGSCSFIDYDSHATGASKVEEEEDTFIPGRVDDSDKEGENNDLDYSIVVDDGNCDDGSDGSEDGGQINPRKRKLKRSSSGGSYGQKSSHGGRKRSPIWECFTTTFSPNGKTILTNVCRKCGSSISAKVERMQMHLLNRCVKEDKDGENSFKMSKETLVQLQRFKAQIQQEKEERRLLKWKQRMSKESDTRLKSPIASTAATSTTAADLGVSQTITTLGKEQTGSSCET